MHAGLHSEQLALVDLLVLAASKAFVGHPWSTLSMLVEQLRICEGRGMATTHYVTVLDEVKEGMNLKVGRMDTGSGGLRVCCAGRARAAAPPSWRLTACCVYRMLRSFLVRPCPPPVQRPCR